MRPRSERQQDFEAIKQNLFTTGVATVKAAQAQETMFMTTLDAGQTEPEAELTSISEGLLAQRQAALSRHDYDAYLEAEEKLQRLDELAVARLEREVRRLKAQQDLATFASKPQPPADRAAWTETALRKKYKTLAELRAVFNVYGRTWKEAVEQVNGLI